MCILFVKDSLLEIYPTDTLVCEMLYVQDILCYIAYNLDKETSSEMSGER